MQPGSIWRPWANRNRNLPVPGEQLAWLLLNSHQWIHRRVEALRMGENGASRWHISHDVTIQNDRQIPGSVGRVVVPFGALKKGALRRVDTQGPDGKAMSILGTHENSQHAIDMLSFLARGLLDPRALEHDEHVERIKQLVLCAPESAECEVLNFSRWLDSVHGDGTSSDTGKDLDLFKQLAVALASSFLLLVEIDARFLGTRVVLKYSRDDDIASRQQSSPYDRIPKVVDIDLPDFGLAKSFHLEMEVPRGIKVLTFEMVEFDGDGSQFTVHKDGSTGSGYISHIACGPNHRLATAQARLEVAPTKQGLVSFCLYGVPVVFVIALLAAIGVCVPNSIVPKSTSLSTSSVSILLVGPALFLSWLSRAPEHFLVAQVLRPFRAVLMVSALSLVLLAAIAAIELMPWLAEWLSVGIGSCILWAVLQVIYLQGSLLSLGRRTLVEKEDGSS